MTAAGRNDPCPCGSGKKHKQCCLRRQEAEAGRALDRSRAVATAAAWLMSQHTDGFAEAIEDGYYRSLDDEGWELLRALPEDLREVAELNAMEWVLAEGEIYLGEGDDAPRSRAMELVLGPGGPALSPDQRAYLEAMASRPLRVYEVLESRPGEGLLLKDLLDPALNPHWVGDRRASRDIVPWQVIGVRLLPAGADWEFSLAAYPLSAELGAVIAEELPEKIAKAARSIPPDTPAGVLERATGKAIIATWLFDLLAPQRIRKLVDAGTGDPVLLVTDHFEVLGWDGLARALESQPDVEGSRESGWTRFVDLKGGHRRSLLAINLSEMHPDRIEPFARTRRLADEGRAWLEALAGDSIRFLARDLVDPTSSAALAKRRGPKPPPGERLNLSPADQTRLAQQIYEHIYAKWADEPIPALGGRTPRRAVETPEGRRGVVRLIKSYETAEFKRAREERREPADLGFLWRQADLAREEVLSGVARPPLG